MSPQASAAEEIRRIYDQVIAQGVKPRSIEGATDEEIDRWALAQHVNSVPEAVRAVLHLIGAEHGRWLAGSSVGTRVGGMSKRAAGAVLDRHHNAMADSVGMLVLVDHQSYAFHVIDGAALTTENPPVWSITEDSGARIGWPSVTAWFEANSPDVRAIRERLEVMHEAGYWIPPGWSEDIDLDILEQRDNSE